MLQPIALQPTQPSCIVSGARAGQPRQPGGIVVVADKSLEQPQRHPFVPVLVFLHDHSAQPRLKGRTGLAQVVQQRRQRGQQGNVLACVPVVFVMVAQYVAAGGIGGYGTLRVKAACIAHCPEQLAVVESANPVAGDSCIFSGSFFEQAAQRVQARTGNRRLPGTVATALGELVENAARLRQRAFVALGNQ